jgi:hypothetical protein
MLDAVRRYNLITVAAVFLQNGAWFLAPNPTLYSDQDVMKEVKQYAEHNFPLTVIGLSRAGKVNLIPARTNGIRDVFPIHSN